MLDQGLFSCGLIRCLDVCVCELLHLQPQIRNIAANLCVDSKHGATGTELRLDICVKDGSERTWSHEQVRQLPEARAVGATEGLRQTQRDAAGTNLRMVQVVRVEL
ncbi:hypothetical protein P7K49_005661 [Saguinus oedipus]|uniref:Uncharacterized protein n=1 Tax=Saguinus oedipus TaxID=9490 RepID=A0ABQ9W080_SAGOE|nr:hypothetical protein P7K49_005661 [Saguinus oedipus]